MRVEERNEDGYCLVKASIAYCMSGNCRVAALNPWKPLLLSTPADSAGCLEFPHTGQNS